MPEDMIDQGNVTVRNLVFGPSSLEVQKSSLKKSDPRPADEDQLLPPARSTTGKASVSIVEPVEYNRIVKEEREKSNEFIRQLISSIKMETRKELADEKEAEFMNELARTGGDNNNEDRNGPDNMRLTMTANNDNKLIQEYEKVLNRQDLNTVDFSMTGSMNFDEKMRMSTVMPVGSQIFDEKPKASSTANASQLAQQASLQNQNNKFVIFTHIFLFFFLKHETSKSSSVVKSIMKSPSLPGYFVFIYLSILIMSWISCCNFICFRNQINFIL
jgi:hypothetical protein